jgi:hypothetical protein
MNEELKRSGMLIWKNNYFIVDVMSIGCGERYWVKYCIDGKWEQRNFYKPHRVISFFRSLRKADLTPVSVRARNHDKVLDELLSLLQPA